MLQSRCIIFVSEYCKSSFRAGMGFLFSRFARILVKTLLEISSQLLKLPFFLKAYRDNTPDVTQYRDALSETFSIIREGSWIIVDNGGALGDILDSIVGSGNRYLTRVKSNKSDDKRMSECRNGQEYVEDGVCCLRHTFDSSGRTNHLYFSVFFQ